MDLTLNSAIGIAGQTLAALYAAMPVKIVLLLLSLLFCFAGYRLLRAVSALSGVALGVVLGICVTSLFSASMNELLGLTLTVLAIVVLGVALGVVFFCWYPLGVFTVCACAGAAVVYLPGLFVAQHAQAAFWLVLAGGAVLFGVTGVLFLRPAGILSTGVFGFFAAFVLVDLFARPQGLTTVVLGLALTLAGCAVQAVTGRGADVLPFGERNGRTVAAEPKDSGDAHLRAPAPEEDGVDDDTHGLDLSQLPQEEPDEIDSISQTVAAHIGLTEPMTPEQARGTEPLYPEIAREEEPVRELSSSDDPEMAEDRTILLSLEDVLNQQQDVPLEQQAQFAWMSEQPVETPASDAEPEGTMPLRGMWNDIFRPGAEPGEEAEPVEETEPAAVESTEDLPQASESDSVEPEAAADIEQMLGSTADLTRALEQALGALEKPEKTDAEPDVDMMWEQLFPSEEDRPEAPAHTGRTAEGSVGESEEQANRVESDVDSEEDAIWEQMFPPMFKEEPPEEDFDAEPEEEPEIAAEAADELMEVSDDTEQTESADMSEPEKPRKEFSVRLLWPALLTVVVLVLAGIGIRYVELALALCFVCYVLRYYRAAAFACAVLCVRRVLDVVQLIVRGGSWLEIVLDALCAAAFLALTYAAMRAYTALRHADAEETEE